MNQSLEYCKAGKKLMDIPPMTNEEIVAFNKLLLENRAVQLRVVNGFADNFSPRVIPTRLNSVFKPSYLNRKTFA
jgi:hypothetical protein